ncbi:MAG: hypothetical protein ACFFG0_54140 [Candidatus Thorarchaeota archaeon]
MKLIIAKNKKDVISNNINSKNLNYKILYTDINNEKSNFKDIKVKESDLIITKIACYGRYYSYIIDNIWFKIIKRK